MESLFRFRNTQSRWCLRKSPRLPRGISTLMSRSRSHVRILLCTMTTPQFYMYICICIHVLIRPCFSFVFSLVLFPNRAVYNPRTSLGEAMNQWHGWNPIDDFIRILHLLLVHLYILIMIINATNICKYILILQIEQIYLFLFFFFWFN